MYRIMNNINKLFVVRIYIYALSAAEAIKKAKKYPVDEVYVDPDWLKENTVKQVQVGFVDRKKKVI